MKKRIDLLLVEKNLIESRSKAQAMIMAGQIYVNEKIVKKSGETFETNSIIKIVNLHNEWVSRGAIKLLQAINYFNIKIDNKVCLDIGASTGGFSQVLLKNNAKKIYAVDVGLNQMHESLKKEKNIENIEKTNARYLDKKMILEKIDFIVCDVSFISMKKVLQPNIDLLNSKNGKIIGLIKPQFEAQKKEIKKGIVTDQLVHQRICNDFKKWFEINYNMKTIGIVQSPIKGPKGNIEFLIYVGY